MKLQLKILLPIILLIVVLLAASSIVTYNISSGSLKDAIINNMADEAGSMNRAISTIMSDSKNDMVRTASNESVLNFYEQGDIANRQRGESMTSTLQRLAESYSQFDRLSLMDEKGMVVASSDPGTIGTDFSSRPYFRASITGQVFLTEPYMSSVTKLGVMAVSAPVRLDGKVVGVVYGILTLEDVYETAVKHIRIGEKGYGYVVDRQGQIVIIDPAHKDWLFNASLSSVPAYKQLLSEPNGAKVIAGNDGRPVEIYHIFDPETNLMSMVRAEPDDVFASLATMRNSAIVAVLAAIILGALVVFILVRPIVKSLNKGVLFAKDISEGRLNSVLDVKRKDEIGQLADALRTIPASLNAIIAEYGTLEKRVETGELDAQGNAGKFSGDFAKLIQGTNNILTRFRTVIDNIPSPVVILNKDLVSPYINIIARKLAGEDYKGKTCKEMFGREDYWTDDCGLRKAFETKHSATGETVAHPAATKKPMDISYTAIPMLDDKGQIATIMQLITDLTEIKSTQRTIMEVANQAMEISNRVAAASEELSAQVDQVSAGTDIQRDRAASTATAMEEMNSTVLEVARNAGQAREQAESTQSKANEGADLVRQVVKAIDEVNRVAQQLEQNMQELGAQAENIGSVMNVISDIADQTNLLALNAAIEAARAGEAGRGFAVVADEVRKLAEKTMGATSEVGASISGIQASTAKNIERVGEAAKGVENSTKLASTSGEALAEILRLASGNAELIAGIATAAEEQSATSDEINRSVEEINRIAGETATGMSDSAQAVGELAQMAQELKTLLDKLQK